VKSAVPSSSKPAPAVKLAAPRPSKSSTGAKVAASGAGKPPSGEPSKGRRLPSPPHTDEAAARVADFDTDICVGDYLVGKFFLRLGLNRDHGAGSDVGQLAVVPTPVVATSPTAAAGAKGAPQDPWSTFCASGEISSAAAAKDVAGSVSQQLMQASQELKRVSCIGLRWFVVFMRLRVSWVFVAGGRLCRPCCVGCLDCGVCCRSRASPDAACGCCSGEVGCGKQKPQADGEVGRCGGQEGGSPAPAGGGEEGGEQSHC
jgi:hypothetical protein